jgi:hypothetical protein
MENMKTLKFLFKTLVEIGKGFAYGWIVYIIRLIKSLCRGIKAFCALRKLPHDQQLEASNPCSKFTAPAYHRPDPCIYDQYYLMSLGLAVTWDNPDITIWQGGVQVAEHTLLPDTEYEIHATIWNNSYYAPIVGLQVNFAYLSFGAATTVNPIGSTYVSLGVKGGPNCPALAIVLWKTPPTPGHYCIQANFAWFDDANPNNNLGQNNVDIVPATSPANFVFRLRNHTGKTNRYTFQVDTYAIPTQPDCPATIQAADRGTFAERLKRIQAIHNRANFPVPPGWTVEVLPAEPSLNPGQEIDVSVRITPPAGFTGTTPFNVHTLYGNNYAGGVTLYVTKA